MTGKVIGYRRVSALDQTAARQLEGIHLDKVFEDKASGKDTHRPALAQMLEFVRDGDEVVVHSLDRLARNLGDLCKIVEDLTKRGVRVRFVKESLSFSADTVDPMATMLMHVMGAFAQFERASFASGSVRGLPSPRPRGSTGAGSRPCRPSGSRSFGREWLPGTSRRWRLRRPSGCPARRCGST